MKNFFFAALVTLSSFLVADEYALDPAMPNKYKKVVRELCAARSLTENKKIRRDTGGSIYVHWMKDAFVFGNPVFPPNTSFPPQNTGSGPVYGELDYGVLIACWVSINIHRPSQTSNNASICINRWMLKRKYWSDAEFKQWVGYELDTALAHRDQWALPSGQ